jgi:protein-disulfide isomerase
MNSEEKIKKLFLTGAGVLLVFIVGGLAWAIMSDAGNGQNTVNPNVSFNDTQNPTFGPSNAKVTVRIYSDFQCPACRVAEQALESIRYEYQDRVRFIWNDMPLTQIHSNAASAASAARCAHEQGKFWEYADQIFTTQDAWQYMSNPAGYFSSLASDNGLDQQQFEECHTTGKYMSLIEKDFQEAISFNLTGTPTFYINNTVTVGAMSASAWRTALDSALSE